MKIKGLCCMVIHVHYIINYYSGLRGGKILSPEQLSVVMEAAGLYLVAVVC